MTSHQTQSPLMKPLAVSKIFMWIFLYPCSSVADKNVSKILKFIHPDTLYLINAWTIEIKKDLLRILNKVCCHFWVKTKMKSMKGNSKFSCDINKEKRFPQWLSRASSLKPISSRKLCFLSLLWLWNCIAIGCYIITNISIAWSYFALEELDWKVFGILPSFTQLSIELWRRSLELLVRTSNS